MKKRTSIVVLVIVALFATPLAANAGGRPLTADLSSANEVPDSGTGATGHASLILNQGQGRVCFAIEADGLVGDVVAGHIHVGQAGTNGGVVVNLGLSSETMSGCIEGVAAELIKAIRQSPADYYVNVHTTAVPSGEIRGQLAK